MVMSSSALVYKNTIYQVTWGTSSLLSLLWILHTTCKNPSLIHSRSLLLVESSWTTLYTIKKTDFLCPAPLISLPSVVNCYYCLPLLLFLLIREKLLNALMWIQHHTCKTPYQVSIFSRHQRRNQNFCKSIQDIVQQQTMDNYDWCPEKRNIMSVDLKHTRLCAVIHSVVEMVSGF